jgi:hypothetical protein
LEYGVAMKAQNKTIWTQVRLSPAEKKMLEAQAKHFGLSVSAYLRMLVYEKAAGPDSVQDSSPEGAPPRREGPLARREESV